MTTRNKQLQTSTGDRGDSDLARSLEDDLVNRYGPIVGVAQLSILLGYPSQAALRQAVARGTVPVPVFDIAHRRGRFALVRDVAIWLAEQRNASAIKGNQRE